MRRRKLLVFAFASVALVPSAAHASNGEPSSYAKYRGRTIDLSKSWEGAEACWIGDSGNECYDTYDQMLKDHPDLERPAGAQSGDAARSGEAAILASCSTAVQLFDGSGFGGASLALATQNAWLNLSTWNFANRTSSYAVGGCSSTFADAGSNYPGPTGAGASASSMLSGWNNRLTRIWIY
jgi:hypothetical protein